MFDVYSKLSLNISSQLTFEKKTVSFCPKREVDPFIYVYKIQGSTKIVDFSNVI